ncbi:RNA polymerase, sigma 28 subunit, SigD/FliA/WhiG [Micrococcales bacterium KH10]|nr:RNA polymerase, sigma 28 subunit, SigD/FliA/WhiG [Micrococcales bacterium KH10]
MFNSKAIPSADALIDTEASKSDEAAPVSTRHTTRARSGLLFARRDQVKQKRDETENAPAKRAEISNDAQVVDLEHGTIADVWTYYRMTASKAARERLILHYAALVSQVATRVGMRLPNSVEQADLVSYGMFGLIDAIDKFDPERDIRFETYAQTRIRGAVIDGLRAMDWIPRSVRAKARNLERAVGELESVLRREPTRAEVASHLGVSVDEVDHIQSVNATTAVVALDELLALGDGVEQRIAPSDNPRELCGDPAQCYAGHEERRVLIELVSSMSDRDRLMLVLYYFEGLTLQEIGRIFGVTESRVSQLHSAAMKQLRAKIVDLDIR